MLDKIKGLGTQLSTLATDAVDGVATSVKEGAGTFAGAAGAAATSLNEKAVRTAVDHARRVLEIAAEELRQRPVLDRAVTLTATVDLGFTALEMQVVVAPKPVSDAASAPAPMLAAPDTAPGDAAV